MSGKYRINQKQNTRYHNYLRIWKNFFLQFDTMYDKIYKFHVSVFMIREFVMVEVTKINGVKVLINPDLLELVEETPDTVLSFTTGRKIIVKESRQEVKNLVKSYRKDIFAD